MNSTSVEAGVERVAAGDDRNAAGSAGDDAVAGGWA
jgi:hypothetical protein